MMKYMNMRLQNAVCFKAPVATLVHTWILRPTRTVVHVDISYITVQVGRTARTTEEAYPLTPPKHPPVLGCGHNHLLVR